MSDIPKAKSKMTRLERARVQIWVFLVLLGMGWGVLTGITFSVENFWLSPIAALLAGGLLFVLIATMITSHAENPTKDANSKK